MYLFTPMALRHEVPHGQGVFTYDEYNARPRQNMFPQAAPDPIRQGAVPSREARRPIAIMSTDPKGWNSGFPDAFLPDAHVRIRRLQPAGRQLDIRAQQAVGVRPNIDRGSVAAYGSLFTLTAPVYDTSRY